MINPCLGLRCMLIALPGICITDLSPLFLTFPVGLVVHFVSLDYLDILDTL